jgi:hypothetical protein
MRRVSWSGKPGPISSCCRAGTGRMWRRPRVLLTTVTFEEAAAQTKVRLTWVPHEASAAEIVCFAAAIDRMGKGWDAGMELLAKLLAELQD